MRLIADGRSAWLAAEFDGHAAHLTPEQSRDNRRRHSWLTEQGWTLLHVTAADVYRQHEQLVATAARALGRPTRR